MVGLWSGTRLAAGLLLGVSCGGALTFDGDASETGGHPFVILDADAVGRVVSGSSPVSSSPICCGTNYSVAYDPEGVILAVAVENLLCPDHLSALRREIMEAGTDPEVWETIDDVHTRLLRVKAPTLEPLSQDLSPPKYDGFFPGVTKTLPARSTSGVRECLGHGLPEEVFREFLEPKNQLVTNVTGLKHSDLMGMPVHISVVTMESSTNTRILPNNLLPMYGCFAGSIALRPDQVLPAQSAPHTDGKQGLASVLTLTADAKYEQSGADLMRQKATGISRINAAGDVDVRRENRRKTREALYKGESLYTGYLNASENQYAESILRVHNRENRILLYPQAHLHNAFIPHESLISSEPTQGRLTMNMFWTLLTSGINEASPQEHIWFCMERSSSEIECNSWRDCKWCQGLQKCIPSFNSAVSSTWNPPMDACPINASAAGTENSSYLSTRVTPAGTITSATDDDNRNRNASQIISSSACSHRDLSP